MRNQTLLAALAAAITLGACTVVERPTTPTVVQTPPAVVATPAPVITTPPTVTVRPGY